MIILDILFSTSSSLCHQFFKKSITIKINNIRTCITFIN